MALLLAACASQPVPEAIPARAAGSMSDMEHEAVREIRDPAGLAALLQEAFGRRISAPTIQVDFTRERLAAAFMGRRPHGGFGIKLMGIKETADTVELMLVFTEPAPDCPTTQMITSPYAVFAVPAGPKPLHFLARSQITSC